PPPGANPATVWVEGPFGWKAVNDALAHSERAAAAELARERLLTTALARSVAQAPAPVTQPALPARRRPRCRLRVVRRSVLLDGERVPLDMTRHALDARLCFLRHVTGAQGEWISGPEIDTAEKSRPNEGLCGQRWERVRKGLPEALRCLIESSRSKGYQLAPDAWRM